MMTAIGTNGRSASGGATVTLIVTGRPRNRIKCVSGSAERAPGYRARGAIAAASCSWRSAHAIGGTRCTGPGDDESRARRPTPASAAV